MGLMTRLKTATLLIFEEINTPSGALKKIWKDVKEIKISIHKVDDFYNTQGFKHLDVTHVGLTFEREIYSKKNRIKINDYLYEILNTDNSYRLTHLTLKEIKQVG